MSMHNTFVATYAQQHLAEIDLEKMQSAGFDMHKLRIVSHHPNRMVKQQRLAPVLGSFGELDAAFFGCIPEEDIVNFEAELGTGRLFIVAHGSPDEIEQAKRIADSTHPASWDGLAEAAVYYGCTD
ncbi:MAG: hypothetical protein IV108_09390 [Burkholderiales bacterium]|nr:hypothetical protein [Burkholderiales bacterium]